MVFFIADLHLGHTNIIKLCNRPFSSVEEMDNTIIANWNRKVSNNDTVYIVGDIAFKKVSDPVKILKNLNGKKHLIVGNHDKTNLSNPEFRKCFESIKDIETIFVDGVKIVLCHYPILEWDGYFRGVYHIYGHVHNNILNRAFKFLKDEPHALNVGVDITGFTPVTFKEAIDVNLKFNHK